MKLLRQVGSDLRREMGWVVFYGVLTAAVLMAFLLIGLSYRSVNARHDDITRFTQQPMVMTQCRFIPFATQPPMPNDDTLEDYCREIFSKTGNGGTFVLMPGRQGYQQVILLLGVYTDLTPFSPAAEEAVTFAVSYDRKADKSDTISLAGRDYPLHLAPADMAVYHPLFYMDASSGVLNNTLFVFSRDLDAVRAVFPFTEYWELQPESFLDRLIFREPSEDDILWLRNVVTENLGAYVTVQTVTDFLKTTTASGTRTHETYLLFYILASLVLLGAMVGNIYRVLLRKIPEYGIHHLFGASEGFLYARMFLFALFYHVIPLTGVGLMMKVNRLGGWFPVALAVTGVLLAVTRAAHRQFHMQFAQGRGE